MSCPEHVVPPDEHDHWEEHDGLADAEDNPPKAASCECVHIGDEISILVVNVKGTSEEKAYKLPPNHHIISEHIERIAEHPPAELHEEPNYLDWYAEYLHN